MKYEVIRYFTDAQDNEYAYREGDLYPRDGLIVSEQRINDLISGNNFQRVALIKPFKGKPGRKPTKTQEENSKVVSESSDVYTLEEINKMPPAKLKSIAKKSGIDVDGKKHAEIKEEMIEKLGL